MGLKGEFSWYNSLRLGGRKAITFTLTNTNLLQSETFDAALLDGGGHLPPQTYYRLTLKHGESYRFDVDTVGWEWCQGDKFALLNKEGQIDKYWDLNLRAYAPGECPECHGSHRCRQCNGTGRITDRHTHTISLCRVCGGTGVCQTCYLPMQRSTLGGNSQGYNSTGGTLGQQEQANVAALERKKTALRNSIMEYQTKIRNIDWDLRMMELDGTNVSSRMVYSSRLEQRLRYQQSMIKLQSQLDSLEQEGYR